MEKKNQNFKKSADKTPLFLNFGIKLFTLAEIALGAQAHIFHIAHLINGHLIALKHKLTVDLAAIAQRLAPAKANGFHFFHGVCQL